MFAKLDEIGGIPCLKATIHEWHEAGANAFTEPYGFTGKEYEKDLGITYFGARYYNPQTTRWLSPDPLYFFLTSENADKSQNVYVYCGNSPLSAIDENGYDDVNIKGLNIRIQGDTEINKFQDPSLEANLEKARKILIQPEFRSPYYSVRFGVALIATESSGKADEVGDPVVYQRVKSRKKATTANDFKIKKARFRGLTQIRFGEVVNTMRYSTTAEKKFVDNLVYRLFGVKGFSKMSGSQQKLLIKKKKMLLNRKFNIAIFNIRMRSHAAVITNIVTNAYVHKYGSKDGLAKAKVFLSKKTNMMILLAIAHNAGSVVKKVVKNIVSKGLENNPKKWANWKRNTEWTIYLRRINSFMTHLQKKQ